MNIYGLSGVYSSNRRGGHLSLIPWPHKNTISPMGINFYFDRFAQCNNSFDHSHRMYTISTERARCRLSEQGLSAKVHARTLLLCRPPLEQSRRKFSLQCPSESDEIDEYLDSTFSINATKAMMRLNYRISAGFCWFSRFDGSVRCWPTALGWGTNVNYANSTVRQWARNK